MNLDQYKNGIKQNITDETAPSTISAKEVGDGFTNLADLVVANINPILEVLPLKADISTVNTKNALQDAAINLVQTSTGQVRTDLEGSISAVRSEANTKNATQDSAIITAQNTANNKVDKEVGKSLISNAEIHANSLSRFAGISTNLTPATNNIGTEVNDAGVYVTGVGSEKQTIIRVPVNPSTTIRYVVQGQFTNPDFTANTDGYSVEYDIAGTFIRKLPLVKTADKWEYLVTGGTNTYYILIGFRSIGTFKVTTFYVETPVIITKVVDSKHADNSDTTLQLIAPNFLNNISALNTLGLASGNPTSISVTKETDKTSWLVDFKELANWYVQDQLDLVYNPPIIGKTYQILFEYEVVDINCTSALFQYGSKIAGSQNQNRRHYPTDNGKKFSFLFKGLVATSASKGDFNSAGLGAKLDTAKAYFQRYRILNVSYIEVSPVLQYSQNIVGVFGNFYGKKYLNYEDQTTYNKVTNPVNYEGYNIVRIDNAENTKMTVAGSTLNTLLTGTNTNTYVINDPNPVLLNKPLVIYARFEYTLNALNCDYFDLYFRTVSDSTERLSKKDVGVRKVTSLVRLLANYVGAGMYIIVDPSKAYVNGVSGFGYGGVPLDINITVHDITIYGSQLKMPVSYTTQFFGENHKELLLTNYIKTPIKKLKVAGYGDSIMHHNWLRFLGVTGYDFDITLYGLRGAVSTAATTEGAACNFAMYNVMGNDFDIVVTMFGAHDYGHDAVIGEIGTLNINTYIGAYEVLLRGLIAKYPGKIILGMAMTPSGGTSTDNSYAGKNANGIYIIDYVNAMIKLFNFYGMPVVNTYADSECNLLNMTGIGNLYVVATATDNLLISSTGVLDTNNGYFSSAPVDITPNKVYGTANNCYFSEFTSAGTFIRRSALGTVFYPHPTATTVRISAQKTTVIIDNTPITSGMTRFWFADLAQATMQDRVHPMANMQAKMAASASRKLTTVLEGRENKAEYQGTFFTNLSLGI